MKAISFLNLRAYIRGVIIIIGKAEIIVSIIMLLLGFISCMGDEFADFIIVKYPIRK